MDHDKTRAAVLDRTAHARRDSSETEADLVARQMDVVDLIVSGASLTQCARHFKIHIETVRDDYKAGLARLTDNSVDRSLALREEVTARQRELILANMARAKAGDRSSAAIIQAADNLLASIWGLRSLRIERPARPNDGVLGDAVSAYLAGIATGLSP